MKNYPGGKVIIWVLCNFFICSMCKIWPTTMVGSLLILREVLTLKQNFFQEYHQSANCFDSDRAQHFVGPDLCPDCLQRLSSQGKCCQ